MAGFVPHLWLLPVGLALGLFGTLIGAGGGFLLVPLLLLTYPHESPTVVTSISLAVVGLNALSGTISYARQWRVDFRSGSVFALATLPGAIFGAATTDFIPRHVFDLTFGAMMLAVAAYLVARAQRDAHRGRSRSAAAADHASGVAKPQGGFDERAKPRLGPRGLLAGAGLSLALGYVSSLLGIGGGIVHVPALVHLLKFSVHTATATSHFVLACTAGAGTAAHALSGDFSHGGLRRTIVLGIGVVIGAPFGAWLSQRVHGRWILTCLGVALGIVGARLLWGALAH